MIRRITCAHKRILGTGSLAGRAGVGSWNSLGTDKTAVTVTVGGKSGFVLVATGTQLNVQIPVELTPGPTTITITRSGAQQGETARHQIDRIQNQLRRMDETWTGGDAVWITVSD